MGALPVVKVFDQDEWRQEVAHTDVPRQLEIIVGVALCGADGQVEAHLAEVAGAHCDAHGHAPIEQEMQCTDGDKDRHERSSGARPARALTVRSTTINGVLSSNICVDGFAAEK